MSNSQVRSWKQPKGRGDPDRHISQHNDNQDNISQHNDNQDNISQHSDNQDNIPNAQLIRNALQGMSKLNPIRRSYQSLLNCKFWPNARDLDEDWKPFRNCACYLLWLGRNDPQLGLTSNVLQWIINLLLTLKAEGVFKYDDYWIPRDSSTIDKWMRYFPEVPIC